MRFHFLMPTALLLLALAATARAVDSQAHLTLHVDQQGVKISPLLYGIFFEEINRAGDGGLYAEMLQNRSFEDAPAPVGWTLLKSPGDDATIALDTSRPLNANNRTCLKLKIAKAAGRVGVCNEGFKGVRYGRHDEPGALYERFQKAAATQTSGLFVEQGKSYRFSLYIRGDNFPGQVNVTLERPDGAVLAKTSIDSIGADWQQHEATLAATATESNARLIVSAAVPGTLYLDMVSLFPLDTFKGHANGMRKDLAQMIAGMHPAFVRFPGGCYVEGDRMAEAFRWKKSIGDVAARPGHFDLWGYHSNDGLGYHEYLQFCEDVGAEPLFVINCGMAHKDHVPMNEMDEYVQDALDAIEYANGPVESTWGALRAKAGHPAPFNLKLMEIGNENGGPLYDERYALFYNAIKKSYPAPAETVRPRATPESRGPITLVSDVWSGVPSSRPMEVLDEHYYDSPEFFMRHAGQYDAYDRRKHKVYVGEYAVTQGAGGGNLIAAVGEAAFMTGLERNGDVVEMASYAPLLANTAWKAWNPNAIVFDSSRAYGTPSYHVQALFAANRADRTVPLSVKASDAARGGMIGVGTWNTQAEFKDIRVTRAGKTLFASDFSKGLGGWQIAGGKWEVHDGALCQTGDEQGTRTLIGDPAWTDYTLTLKARKTGGAEGFLILALCQGMQEKCWWNIGGWNNTRCALEMPGVPEDSKNRAIETGRWYDIKIEVNGPQVACYLDDKLMHRVTRRPVTSLYATAGLTAGGLTSGGDLVLKVVNAGSQPLDTEITFDGADRFHSQGRLFILGGNVPGSAENSFDKPANVAVQCRTIEGIQPEFRHTFPACSVSVIRVEPRK